MEDPERPAYTYLGRWEPGDYIAVFTDQAREQLRRMGYSYEAVLRSWRDRGWLRVQDQRLTYRLRVKGVSQRMVVLEWTALEACEFPRATIAS